MTKLIIFCGLPGTGKTTLANELSNKLRIFCLHKDSVKESLYDSMKMSTLEDSIKLGYPSVKMIIDLAEENLIREVDVILESPFNYETEGKILENWRKKYNLEMYTIILEIDEETRRQRFAIRERKECHHDKKRTYTNIECAYTYMPEKKLFLKSNESVEILLNKVIEFINYENKDK